MSEFEHLSAPGDFLQFHYVQLYARKLQPLDEYKKMEKHMTDLTKYQEKTGQFFLGPERYKSAQQDVVEQLIVGAGWRIIGHHETQRVRAVLMSSNSPESAICVVTAPLETAGTSTESSAQDAEKCWNFSHAAQKQFFESHNGRQGVGIMCFEIVDGSTVEAVYDNYARKHPNLLASGKPTVHIDDGADKFKTLEVYAFYKGGSKSEPDKGTVLQFVERQGPKCSHMVLPFFQTCAAEFDSISLPMFPDHWVSNVVDRKQYLSTLEDVLGFKPKVNFNAGVVAAGEAIIESTVTGNAPSAELRNTQDQLQNRQQIYLPINNSLSEFGHVHFFIEEVGQGVQHIANRCSDLVHFIQRANDIREITGRGFAFLRIPRSYYGYLKLTALQAATGKSETECQQLFDELIQRKVVDLHGVTELDVNQDAVLAACNATGFDFNIVLSVVEEARYDHMTQLLGDRLSVTELLKIVRNQILIDIQGADILYQIFTRCILQDNPRDEAPFFEFIQRLCDATPVGEEEKAQDASPRRKKLKPGCGGFGIRNFLTLFLSIEVEKSLRLKEAGVAEQDAAKQQAGDAMVRALTEQLNVSNPILTSISDAMTREDELRTQLLSAHPRDHDKINAEIAELIAAKERGNQALMEVSDKYKNKLQSIRAEYEAAAAKTAAANKGS